jgi:hypothetical protein
MPQLTGIRKGWENEKLAAYLLSRISFVAQPMSTGDDLGSDFFCTLFEIHNLSGGDALMPRSSFAIQVKSSPRNIPSDNRIDYLMGLQLLFFVGVVKQSPACLEIYSAEFLPQLFSEVGKPDALTLVPVPTAEFNPRKYHETTGNSSLLRCPLVATLSANDDQAEFARKATDLIAICTKTQANIATRVSEEHVYENRYTGDVLIVAGSGSVKYFRGNFFKRLAEVFYNLNYIARAGKIDEAVVAEFQAFEAFYLQLRRTYDTSLPMYLTAAYSAAKLLFASRVTKGTV